MTATTPLPAEASAASAHPLLRDILEEQFATRTNGLTELVLRGTLPRHGGYDPRTLAILTEACREGVAATAHALRRMSEGTYGICEECGRAIPLGHLRVLPEARFCVPCDPDRPGD